LVFIIFRFAFFDMLGIYYFPLCFFCL